MEDRLNKILALLAKAESSEFPEEARMFVEKAQELMAKHAIDDAMLSAHAGTLKDEIITITVVVDAPYSNAKASLVHRIAQANDCKSVEWGRAKRRFVEVVGFRSEVKHVEVLVGSLMVQGTNEMLKAEVPSWEHGKTFRQSFLLAYGLEVGRRLKAARIRVVEQEQEISSSTALVLVEKKELVEKDFQARHPHLMTKQANNRSVAGAQAGQAAGRRASLGTEIGGSGKELSR